MKYFTENYTAIKKYFPLEYSDRHALGAFLYILGKFGSDETISEEKLDNCNQILKKNVSMTTSFRDYLRLPILINMAISDDPQKYIDGIISTYRRIRPTYFTGSGQRLMTSMVIYENTPDEQIANTCLQMYDIYDRMKKEHPFLTGQEDMTFAALLAIDGEEHTELIREMEECYDILRSHFHISLNTIQNVSHILALTDTAVSEKAQKFIDLYTELKLEKSRIGKGPQLIVIAVLSLFDLSAEKLAAELKATEEFLKTQKGFGPVGINAQDRRLIAAALTVIGHLPQEDCIFHDVRVSLLKTILKTAMISSIVMAGSSLAMSAHK